MHLKTSLALAFFLTGPAAMVLLAGCGLLTDLPPVAVFSAVPAAGRAPLTVGLDASGSHDRPGGRSGIRDYSWELGDGRRASGVTLSHTYQRGGQYRITLTVTNLAGRQASVSKLLLVRPAKPSADFSFSPAMPMVGQTVRFETVRPEETFAYRWDFGDGSGAAGPTADHAYGAAGRFAVRLVVENEAGESAEAVRFVAVRPKPNQPPIARFAARELVPGLMLFDGSSSRDPDGAVVNCLWDFGDGRRGQGITTTHAYAAAGSYRVRMAAVDNDGGQTEVARTVTVTVPPRSPTPPPLPNAGSTRLSFPAESLFFKQGQVSPVNLRAEHPPPAGLQRIWLELDFDPAILRIADLKAGGGFILLGRFIGRGKIGAELQREIPLRQDALVLTVIVSAVGPGQALLHINKKNLLLHDADSRRINAVTGDAVIIVE